MGTVVFKWVQADASEVLVTGTFDDWKQTQKLDRNGDIFEKEVTLPSVEDNIYYKFVVDGTWVTDHTAPQVKDRSGNINNVLTTDRIKPHPHTPASTGIMSGVTPDSTTAQLAKNVPKENGAHSDLPGSFPETPGDFSVNPIPASDGPGNPIKLAPGEPVPAHDKINSNTIASTAHDDEELKAADSSKEPTFGVNPIPATAGGGNPIKLAPGEAVPAPDTLTNNTVSSTVHDDEELKAADAAKEPTFGVNPIPATAGGGNPIKLAPGEAVPAPDTLTNNTVSSTVHDDEELKAADAAKEPTFGVNPIPATAGGGNPIKLAPGEAVPAAGTTTGHSGNSDLPPISKNLIPESSLPMGEGSAGAYDASPTIQSVGPGSTTAALAGAVPLERDKKAAGATIQSAGPGSTTAALAGDVPLEKNSSVPDVVRKSQDKANFPPEASAVPEGVEEKKAVESKILSDVPLAPVTSDDTTSEAARHKSSMAGTAATFGAAAAAAGTAASAFSKGAKEKFTEVLPDSVRHSITNINDTAKKQSVAGIPAEASAAAPGAVRKSISESQRGPEAAAFTEPIAEKREVESQLLTEVPTDVSKGESAPNISPAPVKEPAKEEDTTLPKESVASDLSGISPRNVPTTIEKQTTPTVTSGVAGGVVPSTSGVAPTAAEDTTATSTAAATKASEPAPAVTDTTATSNAAPKQQQQQQAPETGPAAVPTKEAAKKKRRSFFGRLKDKLKEL